MPTLKTINGNVRVSWHILRVLINVFLDTWKEAFVYKPSQNMNVYARWLLFLAGCLFLGIIMSVDVQLHWLVILPLLAIYFISASIIGCEPMVFVVRGCGRKVHGLSLDQS